MATLLHLLLSFMAFAAAAVGTAVALTHYQPRFLLTLDREEARVAEIFDRLYLHDWSPRAWVRIRWLAAPGGALLLLLGTGSWIFAAITAFGLHVLPEKWLELVRGRRRDRIEAQVLDLIDSLVASAKSGMNLHQALVEVADRLPPPIAQECRVLLRRIDAGQSLEGALREADRRLRIPNLGLVIQSLVVHQQRGGRLTELLQRIGRSLREIERVEERVRTETSGIRLSSRIMAAMPLFLGLMLYLASPEHVLMLFETTVGNLLLAAAVALDVAGFTMIRRLAELEV